MIETRVAKIFKNGASQAVRLPADFRFKSQEVYVTRDDQTGDIVLSDRPGANSWKKFFELVHTIPKSPEFLIERPLNIPPKEQGVFDKEIAHSRSE